MEDSPITADHTMSASFTAVTTVGTIATSIHIQLQSFIIVAGTTIITRFTARPGIRRTGTDTTTADTDTVMEEVAGPLVSGFSQILASHFDNLIQQNQTTCQGEHRQVVFCFGTRFAYLIEQEETEVLCIFVFLFFLWRRI